MIAYRNGYSPPERIHPVFTQPREPALNPCIARLELVECEPGPRASRAGYMP